MEDLGALTWRWCLSLGWGVAALPDSMALPASPCKLRGWGLLLSRGDPFPLPAPPPPWPHLETRCHWPSGQGRSPWAGQQHLGRVCDRKGGKGCHPIRAPRAQEFFFFHMARFRQRRKENQRATKGPGLCGFSRELGGLSWGTQGAGIKRYLFSPGSWPGLPFKSNTGGWCWKQCLGRTVECSRMFQKLSANLASKSSTLFWLWEAGGWG